MNEDNLQNTPESSDFIQEPQEDLSTTDVMVGIFTEPGETYASIGQGSQKKYWLLPTIIFIVLYLISSFIIFSDAQILGDKMDMQFQKAKEKVQEQVKQGKITQKQADQSLEIQEKMMNPNSPITQGIAYGWAVIGPFFILFVLGLLYFIGLRMFKSTASYGDVLNIIGPAFLISGLQQVITAVVSILLGKITTIGAAIFMPADADGTLYSILFSLDIFSIWFYAIISIGLIKIGRIQPGQAYGLAFGLWIIWVLLSSVLGFAFG